MKKLMTICLCVLAPVTMLHAQTISINEDDREQINTLIANYAKARTEKDVQLLTTILTGDIDQLVSTGEWRRGFNSSLEGMLRSSSSNPGGRTLTVENIRLLTEESAIVDCKYEIKNTDGSMRRMWSTFVVVQEQSTWKIAAIRNMLPRE